MTRWPNPAVIQAADLGPCAPCARRGRPNIPAVRQVDGEAFCVHCFRGADGPPGGIIPSASEIKSKPLLRTQPERAAAIVADYMAGMRLDEIREKHNCASHTVLRLVRMARCELRSGGPPALDEQQLAQDYLHGYSYRKLAEKYGLPMGSILYYVRRVGIEPNRNEYR